jgi:hypothetical protein
MSAGALIVLILNALVAIPKIAGAVESAVSQVVLWYVARQQAQVLAAIADAAAMSARASTDQERYDAASRWKAALSLPRTTVS